MHNEDLVPRPSRKLTIQDLKPGDLLLSCGRSMLSDLITVLDVSPYSHAAVWTGCGTLVEAVFQGVIERALDQSEEAACHVMDVYRHVGPFNSPEAVVQAMRANLGKPYGWSELRLAGLVVAVGRAASVSAEQRGTFATAARGVIALLRSRQNKRERLPTCSMVVARAFKDAGFPLRILTGFRSDTGANRLNGEQRLRILEGRAAWAQFDIPDDEWSALSAQSAACQLELLGHNASQERTPNRTAATRGIPAHSAHGAGRGEVGLSNPSRMASGLSTHDPLELVTPGDLAQSATLQLVGRLCGPLPGAKP